MIVDYISLRKAVEMKMLTEKDCVYAVFLLTIVLKKMQYDSKGGGHFNVSPDMVLVYKKEGDSVKVKLLGDDSPHEACNGKPDFDTEVLNPCFRAPESFLGRFSPATDVYSLGMLLAFMLQGIYPYDINEEMTNVEIMKAVKNTEPQLNVSANLVPLIYKAIDKKASRRFKDVEEMGCSLMDYLGLEKPKMFSCFSDGSKMNGSEGYKKNIEKDNMQEDRQSPNEPHLDVKMGTRAGEGFKAVAGMEDIKKQLRRDFVDIVSHQELAQEFGIMPSNILLYGAPGNGKTFITQKLAEESGLAYCSVRPSDLGSIWLHGSQSLIKQLFENAEAKAKQNKKGCILQIEELDALCGARDAKGNEHQADEVAEWLTQLNDCVAKNVFVVGTTNRLDAIDPAVLRHGRLDTIMYVGLPDAECRKRLFEIELDKRPHELDIDLDELARMTEGYTSSDISYMVKETARNAFEASIKGECCMIVKINQAMLLEVLASTRPSVTSEEVKKYERMRDDYLRRSSKERPKIGFLA